MGRRLRRRRSRTGACRGRRRPRTSDLDVDDPCAPPVVEAAKSTPARYDDRPMTPSAETAPAPQLRDRDAIADRFKWNLTDIFADWEVWQTAFDELDRKIGAYAALQGTLAQGGDRLLAAMQLSDDIG